MEAVKLQYRAVLENINPYIPGKRIEDVKRELGLESIIKLGSNENPLGCSPRVREAVKDALTHPSRYPDGNCTDLRAALAGHTGLKPDQFVLGAGSFELIHFVAETFINPGDEAITAAPSFAWYGTVTKLKDGKIVSVPLTEFRVDLRAIRDKVTDKTSVIWLCNPNNPTGTVFTEREFIAFLRDIPPHVIVVLDEAYCDYVTETDYPDSLKLIEAYDNLVVLRTFSKIYGLASMRIGYAAAGGKTAGYMNRVRQMFNVNAIAQHAAVVSLQDEAFRESVRSNNNEGKAYLYRAFEELGISYIPTQGNFILANVAQDSAELCQRVLEQGVIIRPGTGFALPEWIRVTIGTPWENETFIAALRNTLTLKEELE